MSASLITLRMTFPSAAFGQTGATQTPKAVIMAPGPVSSKSAGTGSQSQGLAANNRLKLRLSVLQAAARNAEPTNAPWKCHAAYS